MPKRKREPSPVAKFKVGDKVRVKYGTRDAEYPDIPLGGWAGMLIAYHDYLEKNLTFPFQAEHGGEYGHPERVKVIGLGDPDEETLIDETDGLLCEARMEGEVVTLPLGELEDAKPNRQLIDDYCYWFHNW